MRTAGVGQRNALGILKTADVAAQVDTRLLSSEDAEDLIGLQIRAPKSGQFTVHVTTGQPVTAGQLLFRFDSAAEGLTLQEVAAATKQIEALQVSVGETSERRKALDELIGKIGLHADRQLTALQIKAAEDADRVSIGDLTATTALQSSANVLAGELSRLKASFEAEVSRHAIADTEQVCQLLLAHFALLENQAQRALKRAAIAAPITGTIRLVDADHTFAERGALLAVIETRP